MNIDSHAVQLIIEYRWLILFPLSLVESTLVAFITGMLAAAGYFDIAALAAFFFIRDMVVDLSYYAIGHHGGKTRWARRLLGKLRITDENIKAVRRLWESKPARTMYLGKLSYGISATFIMAAGMVGMSLRKFMTYGALVAVTEYGALLLLGYFFGASYGGSLLFVIDNLLYILAGASVVLIGYYVFAYKLRQRMLSEDEELLEDSLPQQ